MAICKAINKITGKKTKKTSARKFDSPEEAQEIIEKYFKKYPSIDDDLTDKEHAQALENIKLGIMPTMSGLCYKLGFTHTRDFNSWMKKRDYSHLLSRARLRLVRFWESGLATGRGTQGVTSWLNTQASELLEAPEHKENGANVIQVVIVGQDGNKATLQQYKTIDTTAQEVNKASKIKALESTPTPPNLKQGGMGRHAAARANIEGCLSVSKPQTKVSTKTKVKVSAV